MFGRKNRKSFWLSFLWGIAPDFFSFGFYFAGVIVGLYDHPSFASGEHPSPEAIPQIVHTLYNYTHSLIIFLLVFLIVFLIFRRPIWELLAWGLHILMDIFTHGLGFFPTPFLWPVSNFEFNGHSWATPEIMIPNVVLLGLLYFWFFVFRKRRRNFVA